MGRKRKRHNQNQGHKKRHEKEKYWINDCKSSKDGNYDFCLWITRSYLSDNYQQLHASDSLTECESDAHILSEKDLAHRISTPTQNAYIVDQRAGVPFNSQADTTSKVTVLSAPRIEERSLKPSIRIRRTGSADKPLDVSSNEHFSLLANGDCGDGICNPYRQTEVADKYWAQRKRLFTKFDKGCKLDRDGWFSVTPEIIANHIAQKMFHGHHDDKAIVLDAFAGVGGNSIAFALRPEVSLVICVDIDESRLCFAANNCLVYDIPREKIVFILADAMDVLARYKSGALASCLQHLSTKESPVHRKRFSADYHGYRYGGVELLPEKLDAIFLSPPWGGMDYGKLGRQGYSLSCIHLGKEIDGDDILMAATQAACPDEKNIAYFLPRNLNGFSVGKSLYKAGFDVCWMEQNVVNMKLKTICVYTKLAMVP